MLVFSQLHAQSQIAPTITIQDLQYLVPENISFIVCFIASLQTQ